MTSPRYGVSTHLFHGERLDRDHLVEIAAHGFELVEVFATKTHFDYHDPAAAERLAEWLEDTRLTLHSMHAPICASLVDGVWGPVFSTAVADDRRRQATLAEAEAALRVARVIPFRHLVVHLGVPAAAAAPGDNSRDAARRSLEALHELAAAVNVQLALEVIPNPLSSAEALVQLLEGDVELPDVGICLDVGHAHLMGDVADAIETCAGLLATTHLHDNRGKGDDHLVPGDGTIDWDTAVLELQKIGYDGAWMFEVADTAAPKTVLERTARFRARVERMIDVGNEMPGGAAE